MSISSKKPMRQRAPSYEEEAAEPTNWWCVSSHSEMGDNVRLLGRRLEGEQQDRISELRRWHANYEDREGRTVLYKGGRSRQERMSYNLTRATSQTACSKIAKSKPRPQFVTDDGDYEQQQRAEGLTAYAAGQFELLKVYEKERLVFRDATLGHAGVMLTGIEDEKLFAERIHPRDVFVDENEARFCTGGPRQLLIRRRVDRGVLMARYPKHKSAIKAAPPAKVDGETRGTCLTLVEVWEAWHLPSAEGARDGLHVVTCEGALLDKEAYAFDSFPAVFAYWDEPHEGVWGRPLASEVDGIQEEITEALKRVRIAQKWNCAPATLVEVGSEIVDGKINNDLKGAIIKYKGTPPTFTTRSAQPPEVYNWIETLYRKGFETTGLSQMLATGQKPAGLDAAAALREYNDTTTERFSNIGTRREEWFMRVAEWLVEWTRVLSDRGIDPVVKSTARFSKDCVESVKWSDVDLERDTYIMRLYSGGQLPNTLAGKIQTASELSNIRGEDGAPLFTGEDLLSIIDFPDLRATSSMRTAAIDNARRAVYRVLSDLPYGPPEPFQNLDMHLKVAQLTYNKVQNQGVDEVRLERLRGYMDDIADMLSMQAAANAPPPPMAPDLAPGGPPPPMAPPIAA